MNKPKVFFAWYDLWIGAYYDRKARYLYLCPLPTLVIMIDMSTRCWWRRHQWSGWIESFVPGATGCRFRQCNRCLKVELGG